jgi:1-acyl-sn-glycerol-3-phosphate acyltransferase
MDPGSTRRRPALADGVRTALALAAIAPGLAAGAWRLATSGDRRRGIDRAIDVWGRLGTRAAGITLAIEGAERLRLRPAVFVFNHQSGVDPILLCALLRGGFTGVAKREVRRHPVLGPAFAFAGTVFVDRDDREQAVGALAEAVATLRSGLAVAIAPEGTRSQGAALGPFKKGGFRLAMAAGVPIVPIAIHDAWRVLPRHAWVMTAATVHVTVLEPSPTADWRLEELDARIAGVRGRMEQALAAGPGPSCRRRCWSPSPPPTGREPISTPASPACATRWRRRWRRAPDLIAVPLSSCSPL